MPSILEKLISDIGSTEEVVRKAVKEEKITKDSGKTLLHEAIRLLVAIQANNLMAAQSGDPKDDPDNAKFGPI